MSDETNRQQAERETLEYLRQQEELRRAQQEQQQQNEGK